ncbi:hypothetical protein JCM19379_04070 [Methyloparacoccus murrellii]
MSNHVNLADKVARNFSPTGTGYGLRELLTQIFREKRLCLAVFLIIGLIGILAGSMAGKVYTAEGRVLVLPSRAYTMKQEVGSDNISLSMTSEEFVLSEAEIFKNRQAIWQAIKLTGLERLYPDIARKLRRSRPSFWQGLVGAVKNGLGLESAPLSRRQKIRARRAQLMDQAVVRFEKALKVWSIKNANVILLNFRHRNPFVAADALNALMASYLDTRHKIYAQTRSEVFREQREKIADRLNEKAREIENFKLAHRISDFEDQKSLLIRQQAELLGSRMEAETRLRETESRLEALGAKLATTPAEVALYQENIRSENSDSARATLITLEARRNELLTKFTEDSRYIRDIDDQIQALKQNMKALPPTESRHRRVGRNPILDALESDFAMRSVEAASLRGRLSSLIAEQNSLNDKLQQFDHLEKDFKNLKIQRDFLEDNLKVYAQKVEEAMILEEMDRQKMDNVRIIDYPRPVEQGSNLFLMISVAALLIGAFMALAAALIKHYFRQVFIAPEEVERKLGLPVLVTVPFKADLTVPVGKT